MGPYVVLKAEGWKKGNVYYSLLSSLPWYLIYNSCFNLNLDFTSHRIPSSQSARFTLNVLGVNTPCGSAAFRARLSLSYFSRSS